MDISRIRIPLIPALLMSLTALFAAWVIYLHYHPLYIPPDDVITGWEHFDCKDTRDGEKFGWSLTRIRSTQSGLFYGVQMSFYDDSGRLWNVDETSQTYIKCFPTRGAKRIKFSPSQPHWKPRPEDWRNE